MNIRLILQKLLRKGRYSHKTLFGIIHFRPIRIYIIYSIKNYTENIECNTLSMIKTNYHTGFYLP